MSIAQLPQSTVKLITSSQVITSVSSAVKELIENSLDAGASNIDVKLDNNGLDRIEVKDDGAGISPSNAVLMGLPHYTSKITGFSDIESLESYGFRGEALSALCQVGNVTVTTATSEDATGMIYVLDKSGQVSSSKPTHKIKGTSIVVAYLFKNIPVRRQFLSASKRAKEELRQVENIVKTLGVINPSVRFTLHHNKCMIWQKTSVTELRQGVVYMVGYTPARELHELKAEGPEVKIEALVPRVGCDISILSKGNADWSMVFINKRPVQSKSVHKVVCEYITHSFGERALQRKSPIFLVSFTLNPTRLDVNLEPNKNRILIKDEDLLLEELRSLLAQYYGNPVAKDGTASVESPAKKRKIEHRAEPAPKPVEILFDNPGNANSCNFEIIVEPLQPKPPQNHEHRSESQSPARRPSVHDKENVVAVNPMAGPSSKLSVVNILDESINPEKWSMGQVKEPSGNYYQGPAVFVAGQDAPPVKDKVQLPFASTPMATDRERQLSPVTEEQRQTITEHISSSDLLEFEEDWPLPDDTEGSCKLFAPVQRPLPPEVSCPEEPVINPPGIASSAEQLGPLIEPPPPRPRNEKKCRKPLQLAPRDDEFDLSVSSQMGRREFAGFTKFARDYRPQIILDNPGIVFTKVAVMLANKWRDLPVERREMYEERAREHSLARKQPQRLDLSQPSLDFSQIGKAPFQEEKSPEEKKISDPSKPCKSNCFHRSKTPYRASIDFIKERSQPPIRRPSEDKFIVVGHLQPSGGWVCLRGGNVSLVSPYRLQEVALTHRLLATYTVPLRPLASPHRLEENDLGADNWNLLLSLDRTVSDLNGDMVVSSTIIVKNGFRIHFSESGADTIVSLTHVAETISFYGIQDLLETLLLAATNGTSDLSLCRPLRVVNHIKGEAVRICRQDPSVMERRVLEELLLYWEIHLSPSDLCLHSKPIWTPVHTISATST